MATLGIDIGGSFVKVGVVDKDKLVFRDVKPVETESYDRLVEQLDHAFQAIASEHEIATVGIGIPGAVTFPDGIMTQSPHLNFLEGQNLRTMLESMWGRTVVIGNDVSMAAYGEFRKNPAVRKKNAQIMIYLAVGTGLGGGIIINGDLYWGAQGFAGEIGHMSIRPNGPQCACGSRGCLEVFISATGIIRMVQDILWKYPDSALRRFQPDNLRAEDVFEAARFGDEAAHDVLEQSALALGVGLGSLINIFNPDAIVVGGGVLGSNEFFVQRASQLAQRYAFKVPYRHCLIVTSHLRYYAGVWGAALFAQDWVKKTQPSPPPVS